MLDGKTIIVTGAASGVGRATVPYLAESNANVIAFDINDPAEAVEAAAAKGGTARAFTGDVRSAESWSEVVRLAVTEFGTVHGLANVAAFFDVDGDDRLVSVTDDVWNRSIDVNLRGPYLAMKTVLPVMLGQGHGSIVNISSSAARRGIGNLASYSASKGGLESLPGRPPPSTAPAASGRTSSPWARSRRHCCAQWARWTEYRCGGSGNRWTSPRPSSSSCPTAPPTLPGSRCRSTAA
jgi:hypothetical protein